METRGKQGELERGPLGWKDVRPSEVASAAPPKFSSDFLLNTLLLQMLDLYNNNNRLLAGSYSGSSSREGEARIVRKAVEIGAMSS